MKTVAFVPIKMNSRRLPNKNILPLGNHPLCYHLVNTLCHVDRIDEVYIFCSTDEIMRYMPPGARYLQREAALDTDSTLGQEIYDSFVAKIDADVYLLAHVTSPFLKATTIEEALVKVQSGQNDSAFSACRIQTFLWYHGAPINYEPTHIPRTQDLMPAFYETSGFYIFQKKIWTGLHRRIGHNPFIMEVKAAEAVDIDTREDYELAIGYANRLNEDAPLGIIKILVSDVDGSLTDGNAIYTTSGVVAKSFSLRDGFGVSLLKQHNIVPAVVSGRDDEVNQARFRELGIHDVFAPCPRKQDAIQMLCVRYGVTPAEIAYFGDDVNDLPAMHECGFTGAPADAVEEVRAFVNYVCGARSGNGAYREFCEEVLTRNRSFERL